MFGILIFTNILFRLGIRNLTKREPIFELNTSQEINLSNLENNSISFSVTDSSKCVPISFSPNCSKYEDFLDLFVYDNLTFNDFQNVTNCTFIESSALPPVFKFTCFFDNSIQYNFSSEFVDISNYTELPEYFGNLSNIDTYLYWTRNNWPGLAVISSNSPTDFAANWNPPYYYFSFPYPNNKTKLMTGGFVEIYKNNNLIQRFPLYNIYDGNPNKFYQIELPFSSSLFK